MKTFLRLLPAALGAFLAGTAPFLVCAQSATTAPATPSPAEASAPAKASKTSSATSSEVGSGKKAAPLSSDANRGNDEASVHTGASTFASDRDPNLISTPPPPVRPETKPPAPAGLYVWVPGHYAPAKGEWQWIPGEWSVPATPSSVWIEGRYDEKTKRYSPGYWQPDRPPAPQTNGNNIEKESPVIAPGGY